MIQEDGAKLLFPTSFGYYDPYILREAPKFPKVTFEHAGGLWTDKSPKNIGSYFGYIFEGQFINGIMAGYASKSGKLGFVAAKPIPQVLQNINAFTLGATTTVYGGVYWSDPGGSSGDHMPLGYSSTSGSAAASRAPAGPSSAGIR